MGTLKKVLIGLSSLVTSTLVAAFFLKKDFEAEQEVIINKPKNEVFNYLKYLKNQDKFSVWAKMDPNMKREFTGTDGTEGFISSWASFNKNVGTGEQEIKKIIDGERIDYELRFFKPWKATNPAYIITEDINGTSTKVRWGMKGKMEFPTNLMLLFMDMEEMLGKDFRTGLYNLKKILEEKQQPVIS